MEYFQKALTIREAVLDSQHPDLAVSYNNIGNIYFFMKSYKTALEYYLKSVAIEEGNLGSEHPSLALSYNNIALSYEETGRYKKAMSYYQKAIAVQEAVFGTKHPELATFYSNIGNNYGKLGDYKTALHYLKKAIAIDEETLGSKHPDLGSRYNNIAIIYRDVKDFKQAMAFQEKALNIVEKALPEDHPNRKKMRNNLAKIYNARGLDKYDKRKYLQAIEDYQKALEIPNKIEALQSNLGMAYAKNKQFKEAKAAFSAYEKPFPKKGETYRNWAMYYALQDEKEKALENLKKAIDLGYDNLEWLKTDDSIDNLRQEKAFIEMMKKLEKRK